MKFYSTKNKSHIVNFREAITKGLAPDGGLYYPVSIPKFSSTELKDLNRNSLQEVATKILKKWLGDEIDDLSISKIVNEASNFPIPIVEVGDKKILEVFHGPTMAFKDVAARYLARFMNYFLAQSGEKIKILVATSGDTGGAIAHGFGGVENIEVYVLYPKGKVSKLQEEQLTRVQSNIFPIEVAGFFDDCQKMVKQALVDSDLSEFNLTTANSISVGRLIPQMIYYAYSYAQLNQTNIEATVPSGNLGNLTAGLFAREMGIPIKKFIVATNLNDSVVRYFNSGIFEVKQTIETLSNAMDIGNPSNFDRILELFGHSHTKFIKNIIASKVTDKETIQSILEVYREHNYLLDPHTAVGWTASEKFGNSDSTQLLISTASPTKFAEEIRQNTGIDVNDQEEIKKLKINPSKKIEISNNYHEFKSILLDNN
jgi:threonine synthase